MEEGEAVVKLFVGGAVTMLALVLALRWFGWLPVVLVVGAVGAGAGGMLILLAIEFQRSVGRWFGW